MIVGFVGSGNMAAAMARGMAGSVGALLFSDAGSGRATQLATELRGEAVQSNAELAERADIVIVAVKPPKLEEVAAELTGAKTVVSLLGATSLDRLKTAFPGSKVVRVMPNVGVEIGKGVLCVTGDADPALMEVLNGLGYVVELPDSEFDAATAVMGCAPAYLALAVEAIADAGAADGLDKDLALRLVVETAVGTAELLRLHHPAELRTAVASPGGSTEAGLGALDREGGRQAFEAAVRVSLERMRG